MAAVKVVFLGSTDVGKTSLIQRITTNKFTQQPTSSALNYTKYTLNNTSFLIWDTAGQEKFRSITPMYFRGSGLVVLVFDVSDADSFTELKFWYGQAQSFCPEAKVVIVGNKSDVAGKFDLSDVNSFVKALNLRFVQVSAKTGQNCSEIITSFAVVERNTPIIEEKSSGCC